MNPVESRPLRYFVAVADELNFARAAERLGIAPPALSRAIAQLETQLGVRLLERSTRRVALTEAGRVLLDDARSALDALDAAARRSQRAAAPNRRLVLALKADLDGGLLEPIIEAYNREQAAVPLEVVLCRWGQQSQLLRDGRADVALLPGPVDDDRIDAEVLVRQPQLAALAADHQLTSRTTLRVADIEATHHATSDPHIWQGRGRHSQLPQIDDLSQLLKLVELRELVALLPASVAARYPRPQIAYRPVIDAPPAMLAVAWPHSSRSLATAAFIRAATEVAAGRRATGTEGAVISLSSS